MNRLIFDIDGTLLSSTDFDTRLYIQAVREVLGSVRIRDDWDCYPHVTDAGILSQILKDNERQEDASIVEAVKEYFYRTFPKKYHPLKRSSCSEGGSLFFWVPGGLPF